MRIEWQGQFFDLDQLQVFVTRDPARPFVYCTPDRRHVFVAERDPFGELHVRHVSAESATELARRYAIAPLAEALAQRGA